MRTCLLLCVIAIIIFFFREDVGSRSVRSAKQEDGEVIRVPDDFRPAVITGLRVEEADKGTTYDEDGASVVLAGTLVRLSHETTAPCLL